jgi:hypothetical protein
MIIILAITKFLQETQIEEGFPILLPNNQQTFPKGLFLRKGVWKPQFE